MLLTPNYLLLTCFRQWLSRGSSSVTAAGPRGNCTRFPSFIPRMFWENVGGTKRLCQEIALHRFFAGIPLPDPEIPPNQALAFHPPLTCRSGTHSVHRFVGPCTIEGDSHMQFIRPRSDMVVMQACVCVCYVPDGS